MKNTTYKPLLLLSRILIFAGACMLAINAFYVAKFLFVGGTLSFFCGITILTIIDTAKGDFTMVMSIEDSSPILETTKDQEQPPVTTNSPQEGPPTWFLITGILFFVIAIIGYVSGFMDLIFDKRTFLFGTLGFLSIFIGTFALIFISHKTTLAIYPQAQP